MTAAHTAASASAAPASGAHSSGTVDRDEVARFSAIAAEWWDPAGKFKPLHRLNPLRLGYIRDTACRRLGRDPLSRAPLSGLSLVDIGCGGGLLSEPLARMGADVTGVDAAERNVKTAAAHAAESGVPVDYSATTAEDLAAAGERFDIVLAMEVIEHVADVPLFVKSCAALLAPGGVLFLSTINRTPKAFALAIVGAEYVLRWLPRGTHDWRKFLRPSEVGAALRAEGLAFRDVTGVTYNPLTDEFRVNPRDLDVNYMGWAERV
ncbi:bifunctional 2-polyprenyl-6-hydroxyphenol methylase/3-demethylubiquinol 3-O-methyltransferase UbiG [Azospirillum sp. RWY-5-1]|uniref:Ubiquinone biosynthesis O-methyltransferase n=1 Tax=Azospirillum oleiclasticum TaxID=2735135 RepID=A0ABX2THL9_9PROT|nr:bifunctional 2-polyprenyl-6-hydroxyphenol methylase/3-demethylubiquinol 3-O-methyltransferase UbiG [Azospirillum oleiclasticum]NYZ16256.1 bifunctional 2-polyprenyl-6-hydroxyphenol methylase/3-demethylubiquinol 3-O-methyltransferase UbiG [Azospirillum oleiclasticum]NYZ23743.1 bifunctional 2-polyprenyl-6-hydroxyphenol methylase/3-demethylubiquinol 3-O-methyltransferase UbiG [Azospirillum oleiclasticum]